MSLILSVPSGWTHAAAATHVEREESDVRHERLESPNSEGHADSLAKWILYTLKKKNGTVLFPCASTFQNK